MLHTCVAIVALGGVVAAIGGCDGGYSVAPEDSIPLCRNYAGTANDSGYPCRIEHSDGSVEILNGP